MPTETPATVSIVTPSFNQGRFIESTIRSVLSQNVPSLEYLVVDAGSTDQTMDIVRHYAAQNPGVMRFVSEPDRGQTHALNKGVSLTTGKIIGWLNSDDTFEPGAVAAALEAFKLAADVDLVYGDATFVDARGRRIASCAHVEPFDWHRLVHYSDFIVQPAAFFTRRAFDAVGGADESLQYAMDYDLFLKIAARFKVQYLPRLQANFRWWGQNKSAVGGWKRLTEIERVTAAFGAKGLPAYTKLEATFLDLRCGVAEARRGRLARAARHAAAGTARIVSSPAAWLSLSSPACWRVMYTGQVLRRHLLVQSRGVATSLAFSSE